MQGESKRYYKKERKPQKAMVSELHEDQVKQILEDLIKIDKKKALEVKNIRTDYDLMTQELIQKLLPFNLPTKNEFEQLKEEMSALKKN